VVTKGVNEADRVIVGNLQRLGPGTLLEVSPDEQQGAS
jgi:hypothetical protein